MCQTQGDTWGCIGVEKNKEIYCLFIGSKHQGNKYKELQILLVER